MLDTNILISIIFFPSEVTREFTRQVGLGNRIVLCDYVIEELRLVVDRKFPERKKILEQFLWAVIKSENLYPKRLLYQTENLYLSGMEETIFAGEKSGKNGTEILAKKYRKREKAKRGKGRRGAVD